MLHHKHECIFDATSLFFSPDIFVFLLNESMQLGIYEYDNYYEHNIEYCGMQINETPLVDPSSMSRGNNSSKSMLI